MRSLLRSLWVAAILAVAVGWATSAAGAVQDKADREVIRTLQRQLRSASSSVRAEAARKLRDYPILEAAKLLVPAALIDPEEEVRRAAYDTLLAWKDDREIGSFLLRALTKETRSRKDDRSMAAAILAVLLASDQAETQQDLGKLLDSHSGPEGVLLVTMVADELGKLGDEPSVGTLGKMTRLTCFSQSFACRRAVVQAMIQIRLPQAVEALITLLPTVDGEVRGDIVRYLGQISGQQHALNAKAWETWWKKRKDQFHFPPANSADAAAATLPWDGPSYYGMPIQARRMVFVIDISGSMEGSRLAAAQRELNNAIDGLPEDAEFNIVTFNHKVAVWKNSLVRATTAAKQYARQYVYGLHADGKTAAFDALDVAFGFDAETVYFLSDGEPNCGKIVEPVAIVAAITQANRIRRISINGIGVLPGAPGNALDLFMKTLAEQNYGKYCRVDQ